MIIIIVPNYDIIMAIMPMDYLYDSNNEYPYVTITAAIAVCFIAHFAYQLAPRLCHPNEQEPKFKAPHIPEDGGGIRPARSQDGAMWGMIEAT